MEGDNEANYAYYALHKLHIRPSEWVNMDKYEKAFYRASIDIKLDNEKEAKAKAKKSGKKGRRR